MSDSPNAINWYPGHMSKAKRQMQEDLKIIDAVVEILDARIPFSSKNPDIDQMAKNKYRIIILNKADLADRSKTDEWKRYYESKGFFVSAVDSRSGKGMKEVVELIRRACAEKIEKDRKKGILNRPIRAMIAGIPNSGKSTFINSMVGKGAAKTGNKPGVTKGKQWIRLNKDIELLDTPGILWPKFEDRSIGLKIAFIGSINDEILFPEEMVCELIGILKKEYPGTIDQRYGEGLEDIENSFEILGKIAVIRACLKKGGEPDTEKAAKLVIDDLRSCKLGNITLEKVADL
ncbi:MAG: ribosome biogenesis GTPase YlqF [Lachnospiraceae bacterium]|nr:ribosome biogenesis GTPase YlqF [Lachnospiraceae bacterium]